jgi:hypothetical protein
MVIMLWLYFWLLFSFGVPLLSFYIQGEGVIRKIFGLIINVVLVGLHL